MAMYRILERDIWWECSNCEHETIGTLVGGYDDDTVGFMCDRCIDVSIIDVPEGLTPVEHVKREQARKKKGFGMIVKIRRGDTWETFNNVTEIHHNWDSPNTKNRYFNWAFESDVHSTGINRNSSDIDEMIVLPAEKIEPEF